MGSTSPDVYKSLIFAKPYPVLQEFAPQTKLLYKIPLRAQKILQNIDIRLTCIDVSEKYIALGSNVGIVYLYDRERDDVLKLRNEDYKDVITCVKLLVSLECMVLCGSIKGIVIAFKIPFADHSLMEKFTVDDLHGGPVTALEWSPNGVKFFSGDSSGIVVCSEIDHLEHRSVSRVVLNESEGIVQLSYCSLILLVSTTERSVLCSFKDNRFFQVGQKARKCSGKFGAVFSSEGHNILYASRPGHRIWKSDCDGVIMETMIFKESFDKPHQHVHLLTETMAEKYVDFQFGPLKMYKQKYLVTWSGNMLIIIDPELSAIVSSCSLLEPVADVATSQDEIFIIEGRRHLRRIATQPEIVREVKSCTVSTPTVRRESQMSSSITNNETHSIFDWLKNKMSVISVEDENKNSPVSQEVAICAPLVLPDVVKLKADDCLPLQLTAETQSFSADKVVNEQFSSADEVVKEQFSSADKVVNEQFSSADKVVNEQFSSADKVCNELSSSADKLTKELNISTQVYGSKTDDIVFRPKKKKKKKDKNKKGNFERPKENVTAASTGTQPKNNVNTLNSDSANEIKSNADPSSESASVGTVEDTVDTPQISDNSGSVSDAPASGLGNLDTASDKADSISDALVGNESPCEISPVDTNCINEEQMLPSDSSTSHPSVIGIYSRYVHDDDDSKLNTEENKNSSQDEGDFEMSVTESCSSQMTDSLYSNASSSSEIPQYSTDWVQYKAPGPVVSLCVSVNHIFCVDSGDSLYISEFPGFGLSWVELNQPAQQVSVSPSEMVVWVLYNKTVYAASHKSEPWTETQWRPVVRDVFYIAVDDDAAWYITTSGKLMMMDLRFARCSPVEVSIPWLTAKQIACRYGVIWVLNVDGHLYCRVDISAKKKFGTNWKKIELPELKPGISINNIGLGDNKIGWIMDTAGTIWFRAGVTDSMPDGFNTLWEVETSEYLYKSQSQISKAVWKVISTDTLTSIIGGSEHQVFIAAGERGVWFCKALETVLHANQKNVIGHSWDPVTLKGFASSTKWKMLCAQNIIYNQGRIWCMDSTGDLFCFSEHSREPLVIEQTPSGSIRCFEATPESVWVLTDKGSIFVRREMSLDNPQGMFWQKLDLTQLGDVRLSGISCSSEVVWACDFDGRVYVRVGTLTPSIELSLTQAWITIDADVTPPLPTVKKFSAIGKQFPLPLVHTAKYKSVIAKVYVGPKSFMVWALDDRNNVYVRDGITSDLLIGERWVFVPGLHAKELCLSRDTVWVLKPSGKIFRRYGITESNLIGDYWKQIPGKLSLLSVTMYDDLWGLSDGNIYHHTSFPIQHRQPPQSKTCDSISDDDWESIAPSGTELHF